MIEEEGVALILVFRKSTLGGVGIGLLFGWIGVDWLDCWLIISLNVVLKADILSGLYNVGAPNSYNSVKHAGGILCIYVE